MARKKSECIPELDIDIEKVVAGIKKEFGQGIIFGGDEDYEEHKKGVISTGILGLDRALGVGGLPIGRVIEAFGGEGSGKSCLALKCSAEAQKLGIPVFYIDIENALDMELAENSGVDISSNNKLWFVSQPDSGEKVFAIIEKIVREYKFKAFIVVDSVAALLPEAELESGFLDKTQLGRQAALMSSGLRKLSGAISHSNSTIMFVNQTRQKIGSFFPGAVNTPGGNALKFYSSVRIKIGKVSKITQAENELGHVAKLKIEKNKVAAPFKEAVVDLYYGSGFCSTSDILQVAETQGIIEKSGAWYAYEGERIGQGKIKTLEFLVQNPEVYKEIRNKVLDKLGMTLPYENAYVDKNIKLGDNNVVEISTEEKVVEEEDILELEKEEEEEE